MWRPEQRCFWIVLLVFIATGCAVSATEVSGRVVRHEIEPDVLAELTIELDEPERECVKGQVEADEALVLELNRIDLETRPTDPRLLAEIGVLLIDCAPASVESTFQEIGIAIWSEAGIADGQEFADCFSEQLTTDSPDRVDAMTALLAKGYNLPVPDDAVDAGAALMNRCMPADFVVDIFLSRYREDPASASGVDEACARALGPGLDGLAFQRGLMTPDPRDEIVAMADLTSEFLACVSFGEIYATAEDLDLTEAEIACLDDLLGDFSSRRIDMVLDGVSSAEAEEERQELITQCLGPG